MNGKNYIEVKTFPNTPIGLRAREMYIQSNRSGHTFRTYGRLKNVKAIFKITGRHFSTYTNASNGVTMRSKEAPYCYEWKVYMYNCKPRRISIKFDRPDMKTYKIGNDTYYMKKVKSDSDITVGKNIYGFSKGSSYSNIVDPKTIPDDAVVASCFTSNRYYNTMGCGCKFKKVMISKLYYGREIKQKFGWTTYVLNRRTRTGY